MNGEDLLRSLHELTQKSIGFASSIAKKYSEIDADSLAQGMGEAAVYYKNCLLDPPEPNRRAELNAILDVAFKAKELRQAIENCGPSSREVVIHDLENSPSGEYQRFTESATWEWLQRLSDEVPIWADHLERTLSEPGRPSSISRWTEGRLISDCEELLRPIAGIDKNQRRLLVLRVAREIHFLVTEKKVPQKFRKIRL